ncbi:MAG: hypothetical protein WDM76_07890 [Limisphaerales bacterium]
MLLSGLIVKPGADGLQEIVQFERFWRQKLTPSRKVKCLPATSAL